MVVDSVVKRMERMHLTLVMHLVKIVMADRQESKDEVVWWISERANSDNAWHAIFTKTLLLVYHLPSQLVPNQVPHASSEPTLCCRDDLELPLSGIESWKWVRKDKDRRVKRCSTREEVRAACPIACGKWYVDDPSFESTWTVDFRTAKSLPTKRSGLNFDVIIDYLILLVKVQW